MILIELVELFNDVLITLGITLADIILLAVAYRMITGKRLDFGIVVRDETTEITVGEESVETTEEAIVSEAEVGTDEAAEGEGAEEDKTEDIAALASKVAALASEVSTLAAKTDAKK